ncbi:MAG: hypothetical protein IT422_30205 [Pirellulaceae bacterium]|nr:hypothetical protein [Pirellulaceae bacterium]
MPLPQLLTRLPIFPLFIAISVFAGWNIPAFYEWTDSDQSRPSPLLWQVPLGTAIGSFVFCLALPWVPIAGDHANDSIQIRIRVGLRTLLLSTMAVAIATALLAKFPVVVSGLLCAAAFALLVGFGVRYAQHRLAAAALFSCMMLPFSWVIAYDELHRILPDLVVMMAGMPAFVPAALTSVIIGQHFRESHWLTFLLTAVEVVIGIWMICLGPKRTIAYLLLVMQLSLLSSLVFHQLCIA